MQSRCTFALWLFLFCLISPLAVTQVYKVTDLGPLAPTAINNWGQVAGNLDGHAFIWTQWGAHAFHRSSATLMIMSLDATSGSALDRRLSKVSAMRATTVGSSAVSPSAAVSRYAIGGESSTSAITNAPSSPECAPALNGTIWIVMLGPRDISARCMSRSRMTSAVPTSR